MNQAIKASQNSNQAFVAAQTNPQNSMAYQNTQELIANSYIKLPKNEARIQAPHSNK